MAKQPIRPPALKPGDTVQIVAPASNLKPEYVARGVAELTSLGFSAIFDPDIFEKDRYTAGTDERRKEEIEEAFANPSVKAIWAARGGYGVMRILDELSENLIRSNPKIVIGYSDITALHLYLYSRFGMITFHGPMAAKDLAGGEAHYDRHSLLGITGAAEPFGEIKSEGTEMLHSGERVEGRLVGGCLSLISAMMGTPDEIQTEDAILFLEDTGTRPYQLDRMFQQMKLAGKLSGIRGIVFGEMSNCEQHVDQGYRLQDVLRDLTTELRVPVMFGFRSGHSELGNITLPLGARAAIDSEACSLHILEAAVSD